MSSYLEIKSFTVGRTYEFQLFWVTEAEESRAQTTSDLHGTAVTRANQVKHGEQHRATGESKFQNLTSNDFQANILEKTATNLNPPNLRDM